MPLLDDSERAMLNAVVFGKALEIDESAGSTATELPDDTAA
jgi:hypothetical protein